MKKKKKKKKKKKNYIKNTKKKKKQRKKKRGEKKNKKKKKNKKIKKKKKKKKKKPTNFRHNPLKGNENTEKQNDAPYERIWDIVLRNPEKPRWKGGNKEKTKRPEQREKQKISELWKKKTMNEMRGETQKPENDEKGGWRERGWEGVK